MWWISKSQVCMGPTIPSLPKSGGRRHWCSICSSGLWEIKKAMKGELPGAWAAGTMRQGKMTEHKAVFLTRTVTVYLPEPHLGCL